MMLIWYLEEKPVAPVWIVGCQLQGARQDLLGVARVALLLVHPGHTSVEDEWSLNDFFGSESDFSDNFGSISGSGSCFGSCKNFSNIYNSDFIPKITTRYKICRCRLSFF
jgi:hypothetical protein